MITQTRKAELDLLHMRACVAGDDYYIDLDEQEFNELMEECGITTTSDDPSCRMLLAAHLRQRQLGFTEFQREVQAELATITCPEELHYLATDYNFDDGFWPLEQIISSPCCDIRTARMLFWLAAPEYFAERYGHPGHAPAEILEDDQARFLTHLDAKAHRGEFLNDLPEEFESAEATPTGELWGIAPTLRQDAPGG